MATALVLTEREDSEFDPNPPKVKGRIVTTIAKAKEIRPLVEKCVTIAKKCRAAELVSAEFGTDADRNSSEWKQWRESDNYKKWVEAQAPAVNARRRLFQILRDKQAVAILCDIIAERYEDRPGGYTRIMRLATPRLGDNGVRAILEFVGKNDRVVKKSEKPDFGGEAAEDESVAPADEPAETSEDASTTDNEPEASADSEASSDEEK